MIFSDIENYKKERDSYPEALQKALDFILDNDLENMESGKYEIQGDDIFANVDNKTTKLFQNAHSEVHNTYIDIHYTIIGHERLGFALRQEGEGILEDNLEAKDVLFFEKVNNESFLPLGDGKFGIVFPSDAHRPLVSVDEQPADVKKLVLKIRASLV